MKNKLREEILNELNILLREGRAKGASGQPTAQPKQKFPQEPTGGNIKGAVARTGGIAAGAGLGYLGGAAAGTAVTSLGAAVSAAPALALGGTAAAAGATAGGAAGSVFPVVGTLIGAAVGFGVGYLASKLFTDKFTEVAEDISEANIEELPEGNNLPKDFKEYIDLTTLTDNTTLAELTIFIKYATDITKFYSQISDEKEYNDFLRIIKFVNGSYVYKNQFDTICGNGRNLILVDSFGMDDNYYFCPCAYLHIYDQKTLKKIGEINVPNGLKKIGSESLIESGKNNYDSLEDAYKLESQPEIIPPYIQEKLDAQQKEIEDQKKAEEEKQRLEQQKSQLQSLGNPQPGDTLQKNNINFTITNVDPSGAITVKGPSGKVITLPNLQGFQLIKAGQGATTMQTFQVGQRVKFRPNPNLGTYTIKSVNQDNTINISTLDGKDAGQNENPAEYQLVKESIRSKILKEINKLLKEAPSAASTDAAPAPAAPAAAPAAAAPASAAPVYENNFEKVTDFIKSELYAKLKVGDDIPQNIAIGLKKSTDGSVVARDGFNWYDAKEQTGKTTYWVVLKDSDIPDVSKGRTAEAEHSSKQRQRVKGTFDGNVVKCGDPTLIVILQQYLKYVKGYNQIAVDGKYGGETHGYLRAAIGEKTPFKTVMDNPSMACEYILFPSGLTKKVLGDGGTFDALKQLIQSKLPKGQKVGVIPKISPAKQTGNKKFEYTPVRELYKGMPDDLKSKIKTFLGNDIKEENIMSAVPIGNNSWNVEYLLFTNDKPQGVRESQALPSEIANLLTQYSIENVRKTLEPRPLEESWSIKNKNKYTQNLFERLIRNISKGN